jgi:hypothetical protein
MIRENMAELPDNLQFGVFIPVNSKFSQHGDIILKDIQIWHNPSILKIVSNASSNGTYNCATRGK